jgi:hypothetical protein
MEIYEELNDANIQLKNEILGESTMENAILDAYGVQGLKDMGIASLSGTLDPKLFRLEILSRLFELLFGTKYQKLTINYKLQGDPDRGADYPYTTIVDLYSREPSGFNHMKTLYLKDVGPSLKTTVVKNVLPKDKNWVISLRGVYPHHFYRYAGFNISPNYIQQPSGLNQAAFNAEYKPNTTEVTVEQSSSFPLGEYWLPPPYGPYVADIIYFTTTELQKPWKARLFFIRDGNFNVLYSKDIKIGSRNIEVCNPYEETKDKEKPIMFNDALMYAGIAWYDQYARKTRYLFSPVWPPAIRERRSNKLYVPPLSPDRPVTSRFMITTENISFTPHKEDPIMNWRLNLNVKSHYKKCLKLYLVVRPVLPEGMGGPWLTSPRVVNIDIFPRSTLKRKVYGFGGGSYSSMYYIVPAVQDLKTKKILALWEYATERADPVNNTMEIEISEDLQFE